MCPFRKVKDGEHRSVPGYAIRGCICEVNKHRLNG